MTLTVGIHDCPVEDYYSDPCPSPSLNSSGIRTLLEQTPAHFKARNSRLTDYPDHAYVPSKEMDLGTVVHGLILGKGQQVDILDFPDWRKKEAQAARDFSRANGRIPILRHAYNEASIIAEIAEEALVKRFGAWPIGRSEQTMVWLRKTDHGQIWCRALVDHLTEGSTIIDLKTTGTGLSNADLVKKAESSGAIQAAWYVSGLESIYPDLAGRVQFVFVFIETEPPYLTRNVRLRAVWRNFADQEIDIAANRFAECLATDSWPGYPDGDEELDMPGYVESRKTNRLEEASL